MSSGGGSTGRGAEEEDATLLRLGPDFAGKKAKCLMNAEIALILEGKREMMQEKGIQPKSDFLKFYKYVNTVKQFSERKAAAQVRTDLETFGLEPFEVAQLGNLCPGDAHEAKALVPSLDMPGRQIDNTRLNELLEQLNSFKQYG